jgi:hypothetical protein
VQHSALINALNVVKEDKTVVQSSHPPLENILIECKGVTVKGSPFKSANDVPRESKKIIEQNNFVNQSLHTIGQQLDRIEEKLISPSSSKIEKPLISPPKEDESLDSKFNSQENTEEFEKKFSDFKIEFHQKKISEPSDTDSISSNLSSFDKLNHMNCSVLTKTEKQERFVDDSYFKN